MFFQFLSKRFQNSEEMEVDLWQLHYSKNSSKKKKKVLFRFWSEVIVDTTKKKKKCSVPLWIGIERERCFQFIKKDGAVWFEFLDRGVL